MANPRGTRVTRIATIDAESTPRMTRGVRVAAIDAESTPRMTRGVRVVFLSLEPPPPAPEVSNVSPAITILTTEVGVGVPMSRWTGVQFDVTDDESLIVVLQINLVGPSGLEELVYGLTTGFTAGYSLGSGVTALQNGYQFVLFRRDGWESTPVRLRITVQNAAGGDGILV